MTTLLIAGRRRQWLRIGVTLLVFCVLLVLAIAAFSELRVRRHQALVEKKLCTLAWQSLPSDGVQSLLGRGVSGTNELATLLAVWRQMDTSDSESMQSADVSRWIFVSTLRSGLGRAGETLLAALQSENMNIWSYIVARRTAALLVLESGTEGAGAFVEAVRGNESRFARITSSSWDSDRLQVGKLVGSPISTEIVEYVQSGLHVAEGFDRILVRDVVDEMWIRQGILEAGETGREGAGL